MAGKVFNCPNCGAALSIEALGYTTTVACKTCHATLDATHPLYKVLEISTEAGRYTPALELGAMGVLRGEKWKIIGYMVREDNGFSWSEYLLYNPYVGFKWLIDIEGHFSLVTKLSFVPSARVTKGTSSYFLDSNLYYNDQKFDLYNQGSATVKYVVGEFYWRVKVGESVRMRDFISPPYMISEEVSDGETNWSICEYITNKEVFTAFPQKGKITTSEPWNSVGANQPNPYKKSGLWTKTLFAVGALCLVGFLASVVYRKKIVLKDWYVAKQAAPTQQISEPFIIEGQNGNLELSVYSPVSNQWAEGEFSLVNEDTGQDFNFSQGVEYYSGYDSDGSWTEGSQRDSKMISSVPNGKYHLEAEVGGDAPAPQMTVNLNRHGSMGANFWVALIALFLPAMWVSMRSRSFEISRWQNSDYSPYASSGSDDSDWDD